MKTIFKCVLSASLSIAIIGLSAVANGQQAPAPDNTEKNERDRSSESKTPIDQSNTPEDLKITQAIRQTIVKDDSLSMTAKNVKIITMDGQVTLRGPVNNAEEKSKIQAAAKAAAGEGKVDNQLEVKAAH